MIIPTAVIIPFYLVSFVVLAIQYFRINPDRRVLNMHFALMIGAIVLLLVQIAMPDRPLSLALFLLGLFWLGLAIYLFRFMPPPRH
jgi:hypothetical protein